jgi:hypothetical protein
MMSVMGWFALLSAAEVIIGDFSGLKPAEALPPHWHEMVFPKISRHTVYSIVQDDHQTVVKAFSDASASGLIRYYQTPAQQHPWISWRWKIAHVLNKGDVHAKQGDDYAARIYIAFEFSKEGGSWWQLLRYKTANWAAGGRLPGSALNYIWANKAPTGTIVSNPFTDRTKMIVLQSGNSKANQWVVEKRNMVLDYEAAFRRKPPPIMGIAIMTDSDNTGESTTAFYGDILLTDE